MHGLIADEEWTFFAPFVVATGDKNGRSPAVSRRDAWDHTDQGTLARAARVFRQMLFGLSAVPAVDFSWGLGVDGVHIERHRATDRQPRLVARAKKASETGL